MFDFFKKRKLKNENLFKIVVESTRSSLDIKIVKQKIVNVVGKALNADRCFILEYDNVNDKFLKVSEEYLSSNDILAYAGTDLNVNIPKFASEFKKGKSLLLSKTKTLLGGQKFDLNDGSFEAEKIAIEYYKVNSALVFPIYYFDDFLGDLVLHYIDATHDAGEDEINLLKDIASQISTAIHQANLYKLVKKNAEKENVLRKLIEAIRTTINLDEAKQKIVKTIGETLNADRCFITDYDSETDRFLPIKYEYLSSEKIISLIGQDVHEIVPGFIDAVKSGKSLLVKNREIFLDVEKQDFTVEQETFEKYDVNSTFAVPLFYQNNLLGVLSIHYVDEAYEIGEFQVDLMKDIANQVAISIYQAHLYNSIQQYAEREALLRRISETIRTSLNLEETFDIICSEIAKITGASRVAIVEMVGKYKQDEIRGEFKISESIKSARDVNDDERAKTFEYLTTSVFGTGEPLVINNIEESRTPESVKAFYRTLEVKSVVIFPIKKGEEEWGILVISYIDEYKFWNKFEIKFFETILEQIYIAIKQSEMYDRTLVLAKREALVRDITGKIRSSLELDETLTFICEETAKLFKVQRSSIVVFPDKKDYMIFELKKEYKLSSNLNGYTKIPELNKIAEYWGRMLTAVDKIKAIDNIQESDSPYYFKNAYAQMGIKSIIGSIISKGDDIWGVLILSEYNNPRQWSNDEKELLLVIASQVYIAINQSELYEREKKTAKNESLLRKIIETIRSSLNIKEIKKIIVDTVGEVLKVDRCFIVEYDVLNDKFLIIEDEYLSSDDIVSYSGIDVNEDVPNFVRVIKNKKTTLVNDGKICDIENEGSFEPENEVIRTYKVDSLYNVPLIYQDELFGALSISYRYKHFIDNDEIELIKAIANQIAIAIHQAKLYENEKLMAERERISRNIIEILRSSIDKTIIKKLFVKNIGKFFNADRVFLAEYDSDEKMFVSVDKDSEYLSSPNEMSFVGIDLSKRSFSEYYQTLLEKREVKIFSADEEIKVKRMNDEDKRLFEEGRAKSTYSFPIIYQGSLLGTFTIEFTKKTVRMSDEDINRIRNMSTQAGIALYHARLYEEAQQCFQSRQSFVAKCLEKITQPVDEILDTTMLLSQNEFERIIQIEYLNKIIKACNQLLELTKDIPEN